MIELILRLVLAGVLGGAALAKLASPASSEAALATFGFGAGWLRRLAWGTLIATELGLAIGVGAGVDGAAYAAAALMAMFAALLAGALMRGRSGAPCACFGSRSRVSPLAVLRNLALAAGFAALPSLPQGRAQHRRVARPGPGRGAACLRRPGGGRARARPRGRDAEAPARHPGRAGDRRRGPRARQPVAPELILESARPEALGLAVFSSEGCHLCQTLEPAIESLRSEPGLDVRIFDEARRGRRLASARNPGQPIRDRARPRRHGARQGHLQQPRPARERAGDRGAAAGGGLREAGRSR